MCKFMRADGQIAVVLVREAVQVVALAQYASGFVLASIADVGCRRELRADLLLELRAQGIAVSAEGAALDAVGPILAELPPVARAAVHAAVGDPSKRPLIAGDAASADFSGDGRRALADFRGDLLQGQAVPEAVFDLQAIGIREVGVLFHDGSFCSRPASCRERTIEPQVGLKLAN